MDKNDLIIRIVNSKLEEFKLELITNNGREGVHFLIGNNQIHLQSINLDTVQRSIKIIKQNLGELKDNSFVVLSIKNQRLFI